MSCGLHLAQYLDVRIGLSYRTEGTLNHESMGTMANTKEIRAIKLAMGSMGPQEGIERQTWRAHVGRTCAAGRLHLPEKCVRHEAEIIFAHQDETSTVAWKVQ